MIVAIQTGWARRATDESLDFVSVDCRRRSVKRSLSLWGKELSIIDPFLVGALKKGEPGTRRNPRGA
jgi:hypothetical protein